MGYAQEHLTLLSQALAAAPDRIQPLTHARLGERKAHNSLFPSTESARMQAGCAAGPQSVEAVKGLSSAGRALMFRTEWYLQDMDPS